MRVKVYLVQKADDAGRLTGEILAAKLTRDLAQSIAKEHAPCRVELVVADKSPFINGPGSRGGSDGADRYQCW
jgi:hypothetical protein